MCVSPPAGYNGNIFESSKGPKGGAFDEDKTSFRFVVGKGQVIPGLEEGVVGIKAGGVRQIVVPPEVGGARVLSCCFRLCRAETRRVFWFGRLRCRPLPD